MANAILPGAATLKIDLLNPGDEERFALNPSALIDEVRGRVGSIDWVLVDEIQKLPKLLDAVQLLMEAGDTRRLKFALTGSSARKLKLAGANLLAGRAYLNELYPLTHRELGKAFDIESALNWGTLPKLVEDADPLSRQEYLRTYARIYLKEEVWDERLVHSLDPFRKFLEIAAQTSGMVLNYAKVATQTGVDDKTVKKYFEILADTFVGFYLESYHRSVRQQQIKAPKFYLFDTGVKRAMEGLLQVPVVAKTFAFGRAFEHFVISECIRLNAYGRCDYKFSYLRTKDDLEIDLIIERPGQTLVIAEIKSTTSVTAADIAVLKRFRDDFPDAEVHLWSLDPGLNSLTMYERVTGKRGSQQRGFSSAAAVLTSSLAGLTQPHARESG